MESKPQSVYETPSKMENKVIILRESDIINKDFYDKFTKEESVSVICAVCTEIVIDPYCCSVCLNSFCKKCIEGWKKKNEGKEICIYRCPNARITPNRILRQFLRQLKFKCTYGCNEEIEYANVEEHYLKLCPQIEKESLKKKNSDLENVCFNLQNKLVEKETQFMNEKQGVMKIIKEQEEEIASIKKKKAEMETELTKEIKKLNEVIKGKDEEINKGKKKIKEYEEEMKKLKDKNNFILQKFLSLKDSLNVFFNQQRDLEINLINDVMEDEKEINEYPNKKEENESSEDSLKRANTEPSLSKNISSQPNAFIPPNAGGSPKAEKRKGDLLSQSCLLNTDVLANLNKGQADRTIKFEIYENERWWVLIGWQKKLAGIEGPLWCRPENLFEYCDTSMVKLPDKTYRWQGDWKLEINENTDDKGWQYANNFSGKFSKLNKGTRYVRRRKWVRYAK